MAPPDDLNPATASSTYCIRYVRGGDDEIEWGTNCVPVIRIIKDWFNLKHGRTLGPEVGGATIDRPGHKSRPRGKPHHATWTSLLSSHFHRAYYHRCMTFRLPTLSCFARLCMCALVTWTVIYADFEPLAALAKLGIGDKCLQIMYEILITSKDIGNVGNI